MNEMTSRKGKMTSQIHKNDVILAYAEVAIIAKTERAWRQTKYERWRHRNSRMTSPMKSYKCSEQTSNYKVNENFWMKNLRSASGIELVSDELVDVMLLREGLPGPWGRLRSPPAAKREEQYSKTSGQLEAFKDIRDIKAAYSLSPVLKRSGPLTVNFGMQCPKRSNKTPDPVCTGTDPNDHTSNSILSHRCRAARSACVAAVYRCTNWTSVCVCGAVVAVVVSLFLVSDSYVHRPSCATVNCRCLR